MKFVHILTLLITLSCIQFNNALCINLSEIKNFCEQFPFSINFGSLKNFSYNSLVKSYETAHKHQITIFGTLGLATLSVATFIYLQNYFKKTNFINQTKKKMTDENFQIINQDNDLSNDTQRYYISPTSYFLLSKQMSEDHPYGIALFDTNAGFIERIPIDSSNKTVLEHYMSQYMNYKPH